MKVALPPLHLRLDASPAPTAIVSTMKPFRVLFTAASILGAALAPALAEDGPPWRALLEPDLATHWTTTGNWHLTNGVVSLVPREGEKGWSRFGAWLWSKETFADFEIEFEYTVQAKGNSGFYFRVGDQTSPVKEGIEVQIFDSNSRPPDSPLNDHDSGGIIPGVPPTKRATKPSGEWNHFRIRVQNDQLTVILNGETVNVVDLAKEPLAQRPKTGFIGFQDHALPLSLRNIRIRPLGAAKTLPSPLPAVP